MPMIKLDPRIRNYLDHSWGPIVGIILNFIVIVILVKFVVYESRDKQAEIEVSMVDPVETKLEELEEQLEELQDIEPMEDMDIPNDMMNEVDAPPEVDTSPTMDTAVDFSSLDIQDSASPLVMKGLYAGRSASGRTAALGKYGGRWGAHTEKAVMKALRWLKSVQQPDGSWKKNTDAMTGLAILTFLSHGETPASEEFGECVTKAIQYLSRRQQESGQIGGGGNDVYPHAIATYALAEAYSLTKIPMIKPVLEKAVKWIIQGQQASGLWDYKWKKEARSDTSVSGWMVQALKAAYMAGIEVNGLKESMKKATDGLKTKMFNAETGAFGYTGVQRQNDNMTGVSVLALQLTGDHSSKEAKMGVNALRMVNCDWEEPIINPLYGWYYITQVKFHAGGNTWDAWNNRFAAAFVRNQNEAGYWDYPTKEIGQDEGLVYSTTLAALSLMVYYRHLPSYQAVEEGSLTIESAPDVSDEVIIKIL